MEVQPINKKNLKGKYIQYIDKDEKTKVSKVIKIVGNTFTIQNCLNQRSRVHLERVLGMIWHKTKIRPIEK